MTDVYAIFGTLLALGIAFPGMLTAWWLLFPNLVDRASQRADQTPGRSLGLGVLTTLALAIPAAVLLSLPLGAAKFLGFVLIAAGLVFASVGAAGLAAAMGQRWHERAGDGARRTGSFVRAAVALELAAAFPILGWFMVIPITTLVGLGGAVFAVLNWTPRAEQTQSPLEGPLAREPQSA